jgi:hypothetical protein
MKFAVRASLVSGMVSVGLNVTAFAYETAMQSSGFGCRRGACLGNSWPLNPRRQSNRSRAVLVALCVGHARSRRLTGYACGSGWSVVLVGNLPRDEHGSSPQPAATILAAALARAATL